MKKSKWRIFINIGVVIGILMVIGVLSVVGYSFYLYNKVDKNEIDEKYVISNNEDIKQKEEELGISNIVLFGSDDNGLTDCIMIMTVDEKENKVKLSSIMRDTWVNIPDHGEGKINWSMTYGGPELSLKTINSNFGLALTKYIRVNLNSLPKIIDKLGGLDFAIDESELKYINGYIDSVNKISNSNAPHIEQTGYQHFSGVQATAYCRIRYTEGNDFKRTERQRYIFKLMYNKLENLSVSELNSFLNEVLPMVETNLSYGEIVDIGQTLVTMGKRTIVENRFPNDGDWWDEWSDQYKLRIDIEATKNKMHQFIFNEDS